MKRWLPGMLALLLMVCLPCGCNTGKPSSGSSTVSAAPGQSGSSGSTTSGSAAAERPGPDAQNIPSQEFLESLRGTKMTWTYGYAIEERGASVGADAKYDAIDRVMEKYGVEINMKGSGSNYSTVMVSTVLAGKAMGDVMSVGDLAFAGWYKAGVLKDLTAAAQKAGVDFKSPVYSQMHTKHFNINGQQVGFNFGGTFGASIYYNKRLLQEKGLEMPHDLLAKGEWTFAKMSEYAQLLTERRSDGTVTTWGFGSWAEYSLLQQAVIANGGRVVSVAEDGSLQVDLSSAQAQEALQWMYDLCAVSKTANATAEGSWEKKMHDFVNGKYALFLGTGNTLSFTYSDGMKDEFGMITFPVGPSNTTGETDCVTGIEAFFMPPTVSDDDAAKYLFLMEAVQRELNAAQTPEDEFYNVVGYKIADQQSYDQMYQRYYSDKILEISNMSGTLWSDPGVSTIAYEIISGISTPGAAISKYETSMKSVLMDLWSGMRITG